MTWPRTSLPWEAPEAVKEREAVAIVLSMKEQREARLTIYQRVLWGMCPPSAAENEARWRLVRGIVDAHAAVPFWNGEKVEG